MAALQARRERSCSALRTLYDLSVKSPGVMGFFVFLARSLPGRAVLFSLEHEQQRPGTTRIPFQEEVDKA